MMHLLLDVAYQITNCAVSNDIEPNSNSDSPSLNGGKFPAPILPDLQPILPFISSLISRDGSMVHQILEAFLSNGIVHASLIGCLHLCSTDKERKIVNQTSSHHQNLFKAAMMIISSLSNYNNNHRIYNIKNMHYLHWPTLSSNLWTCINNYPLIPRKHRRFKRRCTVRQTTVEMVFELCATCDNTPWEWYWDP